MCTRARVRVRARACVCVREYILVLNYAYILNVRGGLKYSGVHICPDVH